MTSTQFRAALDRLGLTQQACAELFGVADHQCVLMGAVHGRGFN